MNRKAFYIALLCLLLGMGLGSAQAAPKNDLQQRAEQEAAKGNVAGARFHYIRAYEDYARQGQTAQGVACGARATQLYYKENYYKEAFDLLRSIDHTIEAAPSLAPSDKAALHYQTARERMQMYMKLRKGSSAQDQLNLMESHVRASGEDSLANDLLYNKAIYHYTLGQTQQGNALFREMAARMTAAADYDRVDQVYRTLIANGRRSGNASLVAQSYSSYIAWKDSVGALKHADEISALRREIVADENLIAQRDSSLASRRTLVAALLTLVGLLVAALVVALVVLLRCILLVRKQKRTIRQANEANAQKAAFISNLTAHLEPTLRRLDSHQPEVRALLDFASHVQTLCAEAPSAPLPVEATPIQPLCQQLADQVRPQLAPGCTLKVDAPRLTAPLYADYVTHILLHLLQGAARHTPQDGHIALEYKRRGAHTHQFIVTDSGPGIPAEERDHIFQPFRRVRDLTEGDGLGLPICKQMALRMGGDLTIDSTFTRGTRFVLEVRPASAP